LGYHRAMPTQAASSDLPQRPMLLRALARPRVLAIACLAVLIAAGWAALGLMLADTRLIDAICRPGFGTVGPDTAQAALTVAMWCAMALAMMLPTAAPMIVTYADLAETAATKGEPAASPLVLTAGYVAVWLAVALLLAALQLGLARLSLLDPAMASASPLFSGAAFLAAGAYQFSALKHACVTQCQRPLPFFFANWTADPRGVFRLGIQQGLYCLGCCWAMMLLMFVLGTMNVLWMAVLGAVMTMEKLSVTTRFSRALGVIFGMIGVAFIVVSVAAHWPVKAG
jgi:predicted metal-binding membrane protein